MVKKEAVSSSESSKANAVISCEAGNSQFAVQSRLSWPPSATLGVPELCLSCGCSATAETYILSEDPRIFMYESLT
jgi:hypothetical protein